LIIHSLFPTPLFQSYLPVQSSWLDCVIKNDYTYTGLNWISDDRNIWKTLVDLKEEIQKQADYYAYNVLQVSKYVELDLVRAWSVKHLPGDSAKQHCHTNAVWSGVYYLDVPPNSGDIIFDKGVSFPNCFLPVLEPDVSNYNDFTIRTWRFTPGTGSLIIFPSQLLHHVEKNMSDKDRYCIGFDIFIRGSMGESYGSSVTL